MNGFPAEVQSALAACEAGRLAEAAAMCRDLLEKPSPPPEVYFVLGLVTNKTGHHAESVQWLERAAAQLPPSLRLLSALGGAYRAAGQLQSAAGCYQRCLQFNPRCAAASHQLAAICHALRQFETAAQLYRYTAELDPNNASVWRQLGKNLRNLVRIKESLAAYGRARTLAPENREIRADRSRALLTAGHLLEGFREHQFHSPTEASRLFSRPRWLGEYLPDKTLFVHCEQGLGDSIQFVRYLPLVRPRAKRVILECQAALKPLLEQSGCADLVVTPGSEPPPFDAHVPLLDLPVIFGTTLNTIPHSVPYLTAIDGTHLPPTPPGNLKIGLVWRGNPKHADDDVRSLPLKELAVLFKIHHASFFSLQLPMPAAKEEGFQPDKLVNVMASVENFTDTAAIVAALDLVISVDTAVAHLAGALGKPVWLLLAHATDWRWLLDRTDSPWYPTMRLFRQAKLGDWPPVIAQVAEELRRLVTLPPKLRTKSLILNFRA